MEHFGPFASDHGGCQMFFFPLENRFTMLTQSGHFETTHSTDNRNECTISSISCNRPIPYLTPKKLMEHLINWHPIPKHSVTKLYQMLSFPQSHSNEGTFTPLILRGHPLNTITQIILSMVRTVRKWRRTNTETDAFPQRASVNMNIYVHMHSLYAYLSFCQSCHYILIRESF